MKSLLIIFTLAGLAIMAAIAKKTGALDPGHAKTVVGILFGLIMIVAANLIPKTSPPVSSRPKTARLGLRIERDAGWFLTLGGGTMILVWLVADPMTAQPIAGAIGLLAFILTGINSFMLWRQERRRHLPEGRANQ